MIPKHERMSEVSRTRIHATRAEKGDTCQPHADHQLTTMQVTEPKWHCRNAHMHSHTHTTHLQRDRQRGSRRKRQPSGECSARARPAGSSTSEQPMGKGLPPRGCAPLAPQMRYRVAISVRFEEFREFYASLQLVDFRRRAQKRPCTRLTTGVYSLTLLPRARA